MQRFDTSTVHHENLICTNMEIASSSWADDTARLKSVEVISQRILCRFDSYFNTCFLFLIYDESQTNLTHLCALSPWSHEWDSSLWRWFLEGFCVNSSLITQLPCHPLTTSLVSKLSEREFNWLFKPPCQSKQKIPQGADVHYSPHCQIQNSIFSCQEYLWSWKF